jgi:hypothetical protein
VKILNICRFFFPTLLLIIFIILKKLKLFNKLKSQNSIISKLTALFFLILLLYSLINNFFAPENLYFILYLNIFAYTYILSKYYDNKIFFKVITYILFIYFIYWFLNIVTDIFYKKVSFYHILFQLKTFGVHVHNNEYFLGNSNLNINGIARVISIIFLIIFSYQIFYKKNYINYIFFLSLVFILHSLQSRFAFYSSFFLSSLIIFINNKKKFKEILIILLIFISPFLFEIAFKNISLNYIKKNNEKINTTENRLVNEIYNTLKNNPINNSNNQIDNLKNNEENKRKPDSYHSDNFRKVLIEMNLNVKYIEILSVINKLTTGRLKIWFDYTIYKNQTDYFFGLGIMSDKILFSTSISNALLYAYFTAGILGSFIYLSICTLLLINFIKYIIYNKSYDLRITFYILALFLLLRSIVEVGFLLYGLDLVLILICLEAINSQRNKLNFYKFNFFKYKKNI